MHQITILCAVALLLTLSAAAPRADGPTLEDAARRLGLSEANIGRMQQGEIVVENLAASSDKDLALALALELELEAAEPVATSFDARGRAAGPYAPRPRAGVGTAAGALPRSGMTFLALAVFSYRVYH